LHLVGDLFELKLDFSGKNFEKNIQNTKFHSIRPLGTEFLHADRHPDRQTWQS